MRAKVGTASSLIVEGPGTFRIKNKTATAAVFLDVGSVETSSTGTPAVTAAVGYEWLAADGTLEVRLGPEKVLLGIVASTEQEVHVLNAGPHF